MRIVIRQVPVTSARMNDLSIYRFIQAGVALDLHAGYSVVTTLDNTVIMYMCMYMSVRVQRRGWRTVTR